MLHYARHDLPGNSKPQRVLVAIGLAANLLLIGDAVVANELGSDVKSWPWVWWERGLLFAIGGYLAVAVTYLARRRGRGSASLWGVVVLATILWIVMLQATAAMVEEMRHVARVVGGGQ